MIDEIYIEYANEPQEVEGEDTSLTEQCTSARTPEKRASLDKFVLEHSAAVQASILSIRDSIPQLRGTLINEIEIVKRASNYINLITRQNREHRMENAAIRKENEEMEKEIARLTERCARKDGGVSHETEENSENSNHNS